MLKETKRARRIRDKLRMKQKARNIVGFYQHNTSDPVKAVKQAEKRADHLASCSCHMCGNPRRHFGSLTMQERRHS